MTKNLITFVLLSLVLTQCGPFPSYLINPAVRQVTATTQVTAHFYGFPRLSADGTMITFYVYDDIQNPKIYVLPSDARSVTKLPNPIAAGGGPDWSPDGAKIVFSASRNGTEQIYLMKYDGTDMMQLTHASQGAGCPKWSPDGKRIAFCSGQDIANPQLYIMDADGGNALQLTYPPLGHITKFEWSPDSKRIVFVAADVEAEKNKKSDEEIGPYMYVMNTDGTSLRKLEVGATGTLTPTWSPDGKQILFEYHGLGPLADGFYLMNEDGSGRRLIYGDPSCEEPHWSRTRNMVVFVCGKFANHGNIFIMDLKDALR